MHPSIVVLPFANLSADPSNEYFSDGLTEEITNALAQLEGLKVIARTSAFAFKGRNEDVRSIAGTLGVGNVLEGSVQRSGDRVRVTVQLIGAADGVHRLSKRYEREVTDVFALEDEISADVAQQLRFCLGIARRPTRSVAAYEAYLEGRFHWHQYEPAAFQRGLACFETAVSMDPAYAPAYVGISQCCLGLVTEGGAPALEFLPKSAAAARRALDLDDGNAEAHAVLGQVAAMLDFDWSAAERHFRRARDLNPVAYVRTTYAMWYLIPNGHPADAVLEADHVIEQDPLNLPGRQVRAVALMFAHQDEAAAETCLRVLEIDITFAKTIQCLSIIRGHQGRFEESLAWADRLVQVLGRSYTGLFTLAIAHAAAGNSETARYVLKELEDLPDSAERCPSEIGLVHGLLGDHDKALAWLDRAIQNHEPTVLWIKVMRRTERLRSDPRFRRLVERLNLPV